MSRQTDECGVAKGTPAVSAVCIENQIQILKERSELLQDCFDRLVVLDRRLTGPKPQPDAVEDGCDPNCITDDLCGVTLRITGLSQEIQHMIIMINDSL